MECNITALDVASSCCLHCMLCHYGFQAISALFANVYSYTTRQLSNCMSYVIFLLDHSPVQCQSIWNSPYMTSISLRHKCISGCEGLVVLWFMHLYPIVGCDVMFICNIHLHTGLIPLGNHSHFFSVTSNCEVSCCKHLMKTILLCVIGAVEYAPTDMSKEITIIRFTGDYACNWEEEVGRQDRVARDNVFFITRMADGTMTAKHCGL